ncbi:MAG: IS4 family transposase [Candidatus Schekmanbacteria bacterium]|nr:IS4 family transposase [Candidatus Schekmanbacteria bacterium]
MPQHINPYVKKKAIPSYMKLRKPLKEILLKTPALVSRGNRPLQMSFEQQLDALILFHLQEHKSGRELLQFLEEDDFARENIAPENGIEKSSFFEIVNSRGLKQMLYVFQELAQQAKGCLPQAHPELGDLVAIDGSFIAATLSMSWADCRAGAKKAKAHIGFDLNRSIPAKIFLTPGKGAERPFVNQILTPGQTGVMDRGYQCHKDFDLWQNEGKLFVCRIKAKTSKTCIRNNELTPGGIVFFAAVVLLGTGVNQTEKELRLVGYRIDNIEYWVVTNRYNLSGEQVALGYSLRWEIEKFFAWWKRYLKVYHLIARSEYGLMVQILSGLITYW